MIDCGVRTGTAAVGVTSRSRRIIAPLLGKEHSTRSNNHVDRHSHEFNIRTIVRIVLVISNQALVKLLLEASLRLLSSDCNGYSLSMTAGGTKGEVLGVVTVGELEVEIANTYAMSQNRYGQ